MRIGFTGTSHGMTNEQVLHVHMLLGDLKTAGATEASHGMCIGSDAQFHDMAKALGYFITGVPGVTAFGSEYKRSTVKPDLVLPAKPFLIRNRDIVKESDVVIATPHEMKVQRRSGTWATIGYARDAKKPLLIIFPDGSSKVERIGAYEPMTLDTFRELCVKAGVEMWKKSHDRG